MEPTSALAQALAAPLFVALMVAVLGVALAASALLDPSLWKPKPSGLGWTVDFANPHAKYAGVFIAVWLLVLVLGLSNPATPGVSSVTRWLVQVAAGL
jgi:hypothetical protein